MKSGWSELTILCGFILTDQYTEADSEVMDIQESMESRRHVRGAEV